MALLLGVAGAILAGFGSYVEMQSALDQRARHDRFEQLANSEVVQKDRQAGQSYDALAAKYGGKPVLPRPPSLVTKEQLLSIATATPTSEVNQGGIKAIHWTDNYAVESIETEDGQTLYPTPSPSRWLYLFCAILPLLGFALPWGLIRAIGWVAAGFVASTR